MLAACSLAGYADEGMWMLTDLKKQNAAVMQDLGLDISIDKVYCPDSISLKDAVVHFGGGCTGEVISAEGLVLTNHHCGYQYIQQHSAVEHDYLTDGFWAMSREQELPCEGLTITFIDRILDVTDYVQEQLKKDEDPEGLNYLSPSYLSTVAKRFAKKENIKTDDFAVLELKPFYGANKYYLFVKTVYKDIRMVGAPPSSIGKFGADTDNWMWPRHCGDFSIFRIYASKDGKPANYAADNVPLKVKKHLAINMNGIKEGDFTFVMGFPGRNWRYMISDEVEERMQTTNFMRDTVRGVRLRVLGEEMAKDAKTRIQYAAKYASSANYWKNAIGMNKCIDSIGIVNLKREYETRLRAWQDTAKAANDLAHKVDFDKLAKLYKESADVKYAWTNFAESFTRRSNIEFSTRAIKLQTNMEVKGPEKNKKKQYHEFEDNSAEWDMALDKEVLATLLKNYKEHVDAKWLPKFYKTIDAEFGGNYAKYVDYLWEKSLIMKKGAKLYFNKKGYEKDPGVSFGMDLNDVFADFAAQMGNINDSIAEQEKYLCAAKLRMEEDMPHYSDANFTMRLSYGQVGGFDLGGKPSGYYTTAESIVEKMKKGDKVIDYYAEPIMHELLSEKDFGKYQDKTTGKMQLCFLTNNDITGGNSGSPMFNGKGELIGLAFDGNWDSLSSDINFDKRLARCIGVDIRYVLYLMDKWGHADRLLKEINAK